jgi:hypothetical protein
MAKSRKQANVPMSTKNISRSGKERLVAGGVKSVSSKVDESVRTRRFGYK